VIRGGWPGPRGRPRQRGCQRDAGPDRPSRWPHRRASGQLPSSPGLSSARRSRHGT